MHVLKDLFTSDAGPMGSGGQTFMLGLGVLASEQPGQEPGRP
jgi:hypothetical protein